MMRIIVTGGMGFIGTEVVELLIRLGHEVVVVDFWEELLREYERCQYPILDRVYRNLSLSDSLMNPHEYLEELRAVAPSIIVHLGAVVDTTDLASGKMIYRNVGYTRDLVKAATRDRLSEDIPGIVFASSAAVYGSDFSTPNNPYGLTKVLGEKAVRQSRGQYACLRLFNVFGGMEHHKGKMASVPFKIAQAYKNGDRFDLHSPDSRRDFVPVSSVAESIGKIVEAMKQAWDSEGEPIRETYDVGTGTPTTFSDIDCFIMQATGNVTSAVRLVDRPLHLDGRYQDYTCAGRGLDNLTVLGNRTPTRRAIEEYYGVR